MRSIYRRIDLLLHGYNVQAAVDAKHHLVVAHEVTNNGSDRGQLANLAAQAKDAMGKPTLQAIAN